MHSILFPGLCPLQDIAPPCTPFYSILGCVLPLQDIALQSPPTFSVLGCPCPHCTLLPCPTMPYLQQHLISDLTPFMTGHSVLPTAHLLSVIHSKHFHYANAACGTLLKTRVSDQNGISQQWYTVHVMFSISVLKKSIIMLF